MNGTFFYVLGIGLAVFAVLVGIVGVRVPRFPRSDAAMVAIIVTFAVIVGGATSFAVLHAQDEQQAKAAELSSANQKITSGESGAPSATPAPAQPAAKGPGGTLKLSASTTQLAFDTKELSSKPGKVTIDFTNPGPIPHNVAVEKDGKQLVASAVITNGKASVSTDLAPGTYTFLCTVPGHAEAGMQGTLVVK